MTVYDKLRDPYALAVFVVTLLLPVLVGFVALRWTRNQSDYFVGGRAMDRVTVALSAVSSGRSSWLVLALSGMAWKLGVGAVWAIVGYIAVEAVQFVTLGRRLRDDTQQMGSITLLDYFASRFNDRMHLVRLTGALIIAIFMTAYVAAQFNAGAKTLATALEIPLWTAIAAAGLLILVYMVLGGYVAVAYNDVIRAVIMLLGLLAFALDTVAGLLFGKLMSFLSVGKINPLIGAAGISAFPMAGRLAARVAQEEDFDNFILMHAMGANTAGQLGSVMAGGILLAIVSKLI